MDLNDLETKFKEEATGVDWIMLALYMVWGCTVHLFLFTPNKKIYMSMLIPDIVYLALLGFLLYKRKKEKKKALISLYTFFLFFSMAFTGVYYWVCTSLLTFP